MTKEPPEAPYRYVWHECTVDEKRVKVFYLGAEGKKMLESAVCKNSCHPFRDQMERSIKELKSMLNVLTDLIGGPEAMVQYFKDRILIQLSKKACRPSELTFKPYTVFKLKALRELLDEGKVHRNRGWVKL